MPGQSTLALQPQGGNARGCRRDQVRRPRQLPKPCMGLVQDGACGRRGRIVTARTFPHPARSHGAHRPAPAPRAGEPAGPTARPKMVKTSPLINELGLEPPGLTAGIPAVPCRQAAPEPTGNALDDRFHGVGGRRRSVSGRWLVRFGCCAGEAAVMAGVPARMSLAGLAFIAPSPRSVPGRSGDRGGCGPGAVVRGGINHPRTGHSKYRCVRLRH